MSRALTRAQISLAQVAEHRGRMRRLCWREFGETSIQSLFNIFTHRTIFNIFTFRYMKPLLTNSRPTLFETLPTFCTPLARILTTTEQLTQTGPTRKLDSDSDLCIDDANGSGARRNSISRVSIRLDEGYTSYKNRE